MNSQPKKVFTVTIALVISAIVILTAVLVASPNSKTPSGAGDTALNTLDVAPGRGGPKTLGFYYADTGRTQATTSTDFIAEQLVLNYRLAQRNTATTTYVDPDPNALAQDLAKTALSDPQLKQYTEKDLSIGTDKSAAAFNIYKKKVAGAFRVLINENHGKELGIITAAVSSKDPSSILPLASSIASYKKFLTTILAIQAPPAAVQVHLVLAHSASLIVSGLEDIQQMFDDPVKAMRGLSKYNYGLSLLSQLKSVPQPK